MKWKRESIKDKISKEEFDSWFSITLSAFEWIWVVVFAVEVFLFLFFKPNAECSKLRYFWLFIVKPSGIMGIALLAVEIYSRCKKSNFRRYQTSLSTILVISAYCAAAIWIHTSVPLMTMLLMLPLILTTLYRNYALTLLQLFLCIFIYVLHVTYFLPHTPYMPPLNNFINITIFCGSIVVEMFLIRHVQKYVEVTERKVNLDAMTGLYNHVLFYQELDLERRNFERKEIPVSLLVMDIDKFKDVNDTYGHAFGDQVICKLAEVLKNLEHPCFCARYGGEEFAVLLSNTELSQAMKIAEEIRQEFVAYAFKTPEGERHFSVSIGGAAYQKEFKSSKQFFIKADEALYHAKENGRNQVYCEVKH